MKEVVKKALLVVAIGFFLTSCGGGDKGKKIIEENRSETIEELGDFTGDKDIEAAVTDELESIEEIDIAFDISADVSGDVVEVKVEEIDELESTEEIDIAFDVSEDADEISSIAGEISDVISDLSGDSDVSGDVAEAKVEETVVEENFTFLPDDKESYLAPYDPEMVIKDDGIELVVNRIKIMLEEGEDKKTAEEIASKVNGNIVGFIKPDIYQIELKTFTVSDLENALNIVESDSRVKIVVKTTFRKISKTSDIVDNNFKENLWAYKKIKIIEAWEAIENSGVNLDANIKVAIIDTGLDKSHSEFQDIKVRGENTLPDDSSDYDDDCGHGTNVAGIIAAANNGQGINGLLTGLSNTGFELHIYKAGDKDGGFANDALDMAFPQAVDNKARVVNLSFGTDPNISDYYLSHDKDWKREKNYYKEILSKYPDVLFVAAAGNENENAIFNFPSSAPVDNIISVAAIDENDKRSEWFFGLVGASNYGENVHIAAPGSNVYTTCASVEGKGDYAYENGTSMAAPFVTGVAALLFQIDPSLTPAEIKAILVNTADEIETDKGIWKRLNALNAVNYVIMRVKSNNPLPIAQLPIVEPILNHPPVVSNVVLNGAGIYNGGTGEVTITFDLTDRDGDSCNLIIEQRNWLEWDVGSENPTWHNDMTIVGETLNITPGTRSIVWQTYKDCPCLSGYGYKVRIIPSDKDSIGTAGISSQGEFGWFEIDNNPKPPFPVAKIEEPRNGAVFYYNDRISFRGSDSEASYRTWISVGKDGELSKNQSFSRYAPNNSNDYPVLSVGTHVISLIVENEIGEVATDSVIITIIDKCENHIKNQTLIKKSGQTYYFQNQKFYLVGDDIVKMMANARLPGWLEKKDVDSFCQQLFLGDLEFPSNGILVREIGTDPVYVIMGNKLRWIRAVEALNWQGINWENDIIDVPAELLAQYEQGNDIFAIGDDFIGTYERNSVSCEQRVNWPMKPISTALGLPITEVENALESGCSGIAGKYQTFGDESNKKGTIDSSEKGTFAVYGAIYAKYKEMGYSGSNLGFPISDEYDWDGCRRSDFEGGYLYWNKTTNETRVVWNGVSETMINSDVLKVENISHFHIGDKVEIGGIEYVIQGLGRLKGNEDSYLKLNQNISANAGAPISIIRSAEEVDTLELIGLKIPDVTSDTSELLNKILVDDASGLTVDGYKTIGHTLVQFTEINGNIITLDRYNRSSGSVLNYPQYWLRCDYDASRNDVSADRLHLYLWNSPGIQAGDELLIDEGKNNEEIAIVSYVDIYHSEPRYGIVEPMIYSHSTFSTVRKNDAKVASAKLIGFIIEIANGRGLKAGMTLEMTELKKYSNFCFTAEVKIIWAEDSFIVLNPYDVSNWAWNFREFTSNAKVEVF